MEVDIKDYGNILSIDADADGEVYMISIVFLSQEVMIYGYVDKKKFIKDWTKLQEIKARLRL